MTITSSVCGVWLLDDVYKKINVGRWKTYDNSNDPVVMFTWGTNSAGELGLNNTISYSSPIQVPGSGWCFINTIHNSQRSGIIAIKNDNTLWVWGCNTEGQLGINNSVSHSSPIQIPGNWCKAATSRNGYNANFAIRTDGTLWGWGCERNGRLDRGCDPLTFFNGNFSSPIQMNGSSWIDIAAHSVMIGICGGNAAVTWGHNAQTAGSLGRGLSPATCAADSRVCRTNTSYNSRQVAIGECNAALVRTNGELWLWGWNGVNQVCIPATAGVSFPTQWPGTSWTCVAVSDATYHALKSDNTLWSWGCGTRGTLGNDIAGCRSSPIQLPGSWCRISASRYNLMAIKTDGTLWGLGLNGSGVFGPNSAVGVQYSSPIQIPGNWLDIKVGTDLAVGLQRT